MSANKVLRTFQAIVEDLDLPIEVVDREVERSANRHGTARDIAIFTLASTDPETGEMLEARITGHQMRALVGGMQLAELGWTNWLPWCSVEEATG